MKKPAVIFAAVLLLTAAGGASAYGLVNWRTVYVPHGHCVKISKVHVQVCATKTTKMASAPKLLGLASGVKIDRLLLSYLDKHGQTGVRTIDCQGLPYGAGIGGFGYRCHVTTSSSALICDAEGTGLGGRGTSRLTRTFCDTASHYYRVLADSVRLGNRALLVLNQDTQVMNPLNRLVSEGAIVACRVGRDLNAGHLTPNVRFHVFVGETPGRRHDHAMDIVVTPKGLLRVKHYNHIEIADYAECNLFNGNGFSINQDPRMLVSVAVGPGK